MTIADRIELAVGRAQYRVVTGLARRAARVTRKSAVIDGVLVPYFMRRGRGEPVVMIHGFGGDKESWLPMASMLSWRRAIVIVDLPGFGAAGAIPKRAASAASQARVVAALLDEIGVRRAHLVGNSMGGGISLRFAWDFPTRVASMTLVGSVGPVVEKNELMLALDRGENPLITTSADDLDRLLHLVTERTPPSTRAMKRHLGTERFTRSAALHELFGGWNAPSHDERVPDELEKIKTPALVVHGERDRVIPLSTARALADRLPNARLEVLHGIGHVPQIEAPKQLAALLDAFVAKTST